MSTFRSKWVCRSKVCCNKPLPQRWLLYHKEERTVVDWNCSVSLLLVLMSSVRPTLVAIGEVGRVMYVPFLYSVSFFYFFFMFYHITWLFCSFSPLFFRRVGGGGAGVGGNCFRWIDVLKWSIYSTNPKMSSKHDMDAAAIDIPIKLKEKHTHLPCVVVSGLPFHKSKDEFLWETCWSSKLN